MSLPNLCFIDYHGKEYAVRFNNFVDRFLMHRPIDLNIEKCTLITCGEVHSDRTRINRWIRKALEHQVKNLELKVSPGSYELIPDIYTYGSFETLRLGYGNILANIPNDVSFSRLKVLEFYRVMFFNYESIQGILLNCPVLEDLVIQRCLPLSASSCLTVCGSALKNLTLQYNKPANRDTDLQIVIDTPALKALVIEDSTWADIFIKGTLLSIKTACIDVGVERGIEQFEFNNSVFQLLDNIFHVTCLTITDKAIGALDCASDYRFPTFHNLIQLELSAIEWSCWKLLPRIIASSPNLQCLLLPFGVTNSKHTRRKCCYGFWNRPKLVPECLSSNLQTIKFGYFHGTDDELSLLDYLLVEGKVLRKISIDCKPRIQEDVLALGFKTCKVQFI